LEFEPGIERAQRVGPKTRSTGGDSNIADGARNNPRVIVWRLRDWKQEEGIPRENLEEPNQRVCLSMKILQQKRLKSGIITREIKGSQESRKFAYFVVDKLITDSLQRESR